MAEILVVDDSPEFLHLVSAVLATEGHRIRTAKNGAETLKALDAGRADLVILDVQLPDIDGYELCRFIKSREDGQDLPILFVSVSCESLDKIRGFGAGGSDYIAKPIDPVELLHRLRIHLEMGAYRRELERLVAERTAALEESNRALQKEIVERRHMEADLRESEERFRVVFDRSPLGKTLTRPDGSFLAANQSFADIVGRSLEELYQVNFVELTHPDDLSLSFEAYRRLLSGETDLERFEKRYLRKDGELVWAEIQITAFRDGTGYTKFFITMVSDITERRKADAELREKEYLLRMAVEAAPMILFTVDTEGIFQLSTGAGLALLGLKPGEVVGQSHFEIYKDLESANVNMRRALGGETVTFVNEALGVVWDIRYAPLFAPDGSIKGMVGTAMDITERMRAAEQIARTLAEKETLLRELYHRTKNNMGVIIALLGLQAERLGDPRLDEAFRTTQNRIMAMALVHQKLYEAGDLSNINLGAYIGDLVGHLMASYALDSSEVEFAPELEDVYVTIDSAMPCGLVLNELVANSLKYGFVGGRSGRIAVSLARRDDGLVAMRVADDGAGFPEGFDPRRDGRMGMQTIFGLVEEQLGGTISFTRGEAGAGTVCNFSFRDDLYLPRV